MARTPFNKEAYFKMLDEKLKPTPPAQGGGRLAKDLILAAGRLSRKPKMPPV